MINLYSVENTNYQTNGDATLTPISASIKKVINGMWQLSMEIPYDEEGKYEYLDHGAMLKVTDPSVSEVSNTQLWRIYDYKRNIRSISVIAFPRAMESTFDAPINQLIISSDVTGASAASSLSAVSEKYSVTSNIERTGRSEWSNTNLNRAICGTDSNAFVNVWGGEVVYDNLTIKILDGIGSSENVIDVMYGKNINEISYEVDDSGLTTRIYPLSTDGIRYWDATEEVEYIDSPLIEDYPIVHSNFMETPYQLVIDDDSDISRTAVKTRDIKSRIQAKASQLSHSIWNTAVSNGWKIDYLSSIYADIIANIQTMVTTNIAHADFVKAVNSAVKDGMVWMKDEEDPEWVWEQVGTDAWKYGSSESGRYARNEWQYIDKKWRYFGDDYYWQQPKDDDSEWTWYENQTTHKKWYGTQDRYYLKGQYIYVTEEGELKKYWLDGDGWYDSDKTDTSDWDWHESSSAPGAWWFGDEDGDNYMSGQWAFIDGTLYWFDDNGYYYGVKEEHPPFDWQQSGEAFWFGNPDHSTRSYWLASQWAKIDRQWYRFDSDGYTEDIYTQALTMFHNGMSELTTLVQTCRTECYNLLYDLMEEWSEEQFANGVDVPTVTINVDMVDLSKTTDYADYQNLEKIHLGDTVRCVDYVHHIATIERVVELTYDLLRGYNTSVTIGVANSSVGSMLSGSTGGGTASNNAINVDFIEQSLALKQPTLEAGKNITLTDNLDGTQTIASDKLIRAGDNVTVTHNQDGSDTISAEGGALEYWIEENTKLYRKEIVNVNNPHGWDCDSEWKWNYDGEHVAFIIGGTGGSDRFSVEVEGCQHCYGVAYANGQYHILALASENEGLLEAIFAGRAVTTPITYQGMTLYYSSLHLDYSTYESINWMEYHPWIGTASGRHFPLVSGEYESITDAVVAMIQQSHLYTKKVRYTGSSIDNETIWAGELKSLGDVSSVTPQQMQFYVTKDGVVEATDYKVNEISIEQIYQKILLQGENIVIGADGRTISAIDTKYTQGANVQISAQNVISATDTNAVADMTDVDIDDQTLTDGNVLKWNATSEKWENGQGGGGSANAQEITWANYQALSQAEKENGTIYYIPDAPDSMAMPYLTMENGIPTLVYDDGE